MLLNLLLDHNFLCKCVPPPSLSLVPSMLIYVSKWVQSSPNVYLLMAHERTVISHREAARTVEFGNTTSLEH